MCGISGIYALRGEPIQPDELAAQLATIVHRGPNQGATFLSPQRVCGLGIRRLSIIDVAGGDQPISNEDGSIHLVYNGETYNHQPLRAELERLGHHPHSHSDAEVIVHGYETWGPAGVLNRLRGMFAFALWDETRQQLFLARDRFGIKPLYYAEHEGRLSFASEIKAILAQPHFPRRVHLPALQAMLTLGFVPGPATMFEGIFKLPPAHFLLAQANEFQIKPYWRLTYQENRLISEAEAAEQFLALLQESVQMHLMSEVPLGALLSGGLDSGALVTLINRGQGLGVRGWGSGVGGHGAEVESWGGGIIISGPRSPVPGQKLDQSSKRFRLALKTPAMMNRRWHGRWPNILAQSTIRSPLVRLILTCTRRSWATWKSRRVRRRRCRFTSCTGPAGKPG
ncbi:MAG: asparagine synthase (glutamine-hydrolyzing) [Anaerolineales bacterium]|nr:asparagine synthase (glutamine-hydrolyzing) [Anaerolineales bacterium]